MFKRRILYYAILIFAAAIGLAGCFFDRIAWSPDGRYVAFAGGDGLWRWDSRTGKTDEVKLELAKDEALAPGETLLVWACYYLDSSERLIVLAETEGQQDEANLDWHDFRKNETNLYLYDFQKNETKRIAEDVGPYVEVSRDSKRVYYMRKDKSELFELELDGEAKVILTSEEEFGFPCLSPDERSIAYSTEKAVDLLDRASGTTRTLTTTAGEEAFYWPTWCGANEIAYIRFREESNDDCTGELQVLSLDTGATRSLATGVQYIYPLGVSPNGRAIAATRMEPGSTADANLPDVWQIAEIDVATGASRWLTDAPMGAFSPAYSPDGKRLAYLSTACKGGMLAVLDLETSRTTLAWRDEEERLFAEAEALLESKNATGALEKWEEMLKRFPEGGLRDAACYRIATERLRDETLDLDKAMEAWRKIEDSDLRDGIKSRFWRPQDRLATDPAGDWIQQYATDASRKEFQFDTDATRDLRGLWVRWGREYLYVRVDYGSDRDLNGLIFQDTVLLFDHDSPERGVRQIRAATQWERGAECQVWLRHWREEGEESQYDAEIRDAENETRFRLLASGFSASDNPVLRLAYTIEGETPSAVYAISRKALGLEESATTYLQVVTLKGGVESIQGLEKSAERSTGDPIVFAIADAFGAENTRERFEADLTKNAASADPDTIRGYAVRLEIE